MGANPGEITEVGVKEIVLRRPNSNYMLQEPHEAKWFGDELGQTWVKFKIRIVGGTQTIVVPSDRIAEVKYMPK